MYLVEQRGCLVLAIRESRFGTVASHALHPYVYTIKRTFHKVIRTRQSGPSRQATTSSLVRETASSSGSLELELIWFAWTRARLGTWQPAPFYRGHQYTALYPIRFKTGQNLLQVRRSGRVVAKLHAELALALRGGAQLRAEAKHGVEAAVADEGKVLAANLRVVDGGVALVHEHEDVALELVGRGNGRLHQRLEDLAARLGEGLAEGHLGGQVEGVVGGIGDVGLAVVDDHLGADDAVAQQGALFARELEALGAGGQELVGDVPADDLALVVVLLGLVVGLDVAGHAGKVAGAAALALEQVVEVGAAGDGLAVGDAGLARDALRLVLALQALDVDLEMQLAHAGDDGLFALGVDVDAEGRVLALESVHRLAEIVGVAGALRLDGQGHDGVGDEHGRHGVGETAVGKGIAGGTVDAEHGADLTGTDLVDILHLVGVHADDAGDAHLLVGSRVVQVGALAQRSLVDTDVGKLTVVVLLELEGESDKRQRVVGDQRNRLLALGLVEGRVLNLTGVGQVVADGIQHGLDTLIGQGRAHHDGSKLAGNGRAADGSLDLFVGGRLLFEVQLGNLVVDVGQLLNQELSLLGGKLLQISRDLVGNSNLGAAGTLKVHGLHLDNVNDALELVLGADGDLDGGRGDLELGVDLLDGLPGVGAHTVHLVDEGDSGNIVAFHLAIDGNRLRLDAADGAENHDGAVEHAQSTLDLDGEVNVAGGVDEVDVVLLFLSVYRLLPVAECSRRLNGDAFFPFQFHRVHLGADGIFAADLVDCLDPTSVEENPFRYRSFATVNVCLFLCLVSFSYSFLLLHVFK